MEGGKQERDLAQAYRNDAAKLDEWPRTKAMLIGLAESWERSALHEDVRVEQLRLRE
jgi:hypothetical protein